MRDYVFGNSVTEGDGNSIKGSIGAGICLITVFSKSGLLVRGGGAQRLLCRVAVAKLLPSSSFERKPLGARRGEGVGGGASLRNHRRGTEDSSHGGSTPPARGLARPRGGHGFRRRAGCRHAPRTVSAGLAASRGRSPWSSTRKPRSRPATLQSVELGAAEALDVGSWDGELVQGHVSTPHHRPDGYVSNNTSTAFAPRVAAEARRHAQTSSSWAALVSPSSTSRRHTRSRSE